MKSRLNIIQKKILHISLFLVIFVHFTYGMELSIKFSGGLNYSKMANINRVLQDWVVFKERFADINKHWIFVEGDIPEFHSSYDFDGELIFSLTSHLALGLSGGYIYGELGEDDTEVTMKEAVSESSFLDIRPTKVNAFPLTVSGYYLFTVMKKITFYLKGGGGLIWAKHIVREGWKPVLGESYNYFFTQNTSARSSILLGGFGIMYEVESGMRFFIEGIARSSKINGFRGENSNGQTGTLFFFEEYNSDLDFWQAKNQILSQMPMGENIRSAQEATVDLSGFAVKIGLIIQF